MAILDRSELTTQLCLAAIFRRSPTIGASTGAAREFGEAWIAAQGRESPSASAPVPGDKDQV